MLYFKLQIIFNLPKRTKVSVTIGFASVFSTACQNELHQHARTHAKLIEEKEELEAHSMICTPSSHSLNLAWFGKSHRKARRQEDSHAAAP